MREETDAWFEHAWWRGGGQELKVRYLIDRYGLDENQIVDLIDQYGFRPARLDAAARRLRDN